MARGRSRNPWRRPLPAGRPARAPRPAGDSRRGGQPHGTAHRHRHGHPHGAGHGRVRGQLPAGEPRCGSTFPPASPWWGPGAFFLLGLLGLSYGVLSASWEDAPGSLLGFEQIGVNIGRVRASVRAMRQGSNTPG